MREQRLLFSFFLPAAAAPGWRRGAQVLPLLSARSLPRLLRTQCSKRLRLAPQGLEQLAVWSQGPIRRVWGRGGGMGEDAVATAAVEGTLTARALSRLVASCRWGGENRLHKNG